MSQQHSAAIQQGWIGPHHYRIEDDLVCWEPHGTVLLEHAQALRDLVQQVRQRCGFVCYMVDARSVTPIGPEVRRLLIDAVRELDGNIATAIFGGSLAARTAGVLVLNAARVLWQISVPVKLVATEEQARAFLQSIAKARKQPRTPASP